MCTSIRQRKCAPIVSKLTHLSLPACHAHSQAHALGRFSALAHSLIACNVLGLTTNLALPEWHPPGLVGALAPSCTFSPLITPSPLFLTSCYTSPHYTSLFLTFMHQIASVRSHLLPQFQVSTLDTTVRRFIRATHGNVALVRARL